MRAQFTNPETTVPDPGLPTRPDAMPLGYHEWPLPVSAEVAGRVEALWSFRPPARARYCVPPDGRIDLVLRTELASDGGLRRLRPVVAGPGLQPAWVPAGPDTRLFGLRFVPGWGSACLGVPAQALRDQVWTGPAARECVAARVPALLAAADLATLWPALAAAALRLATGAQPSAAVQRAAAAAAALAAQPGLSLAALAQQVGAAPRTLRRDVAQVIGVPLQALQRLQRFHRALALLEAQPTLGLAALAQASGYGDQPHLTREFRRLCGATPGDAAQWRRLPRITVQGAGR